MPMKILKFESMTCGFCKAMEKRQIVETVAAEFPGTEIVKLMISNAEGDSPEGTSFADAFEISDLYKVETLPTYIVLDEHGVEAGRVVGQVNTKEFRAAVEEADAFIRQSNAAFKRVLAHKPS